MKLWLAKNSEIPVRVQLAEQIVLGIASGDLQPDEKLPSTRELARRFGIHQNTVSAVYRSLAEQGFLENRKGSGVFVTPDGRGSERPRLDELFAEFVRRAETAGYSRSDIDKLLARRLSAKPVRRILIIESDPGLREIVAEELSAATGLPANGVDLESFSASQTAEGLLLAAMFDEKPKLEPLLPAGTSCFYLTANSVPSSLSGRSRPPRDELIAVVSGWDRFLSLAQVFLVAAKIDPEMIVSRSTADPDWRRSAEQAGLVICDSLTAKKFPPDDPRVRVFPILSQSSIDHLRKTSLPAS